MSSFAITASVVGQVDTDGDGMSDSYETANSLNPANGTDAFADKDGDRIPNLWEYARLGANIGLPGYHATAAKTATVFPSFDAMVDYTLAADEPANKKFKTLQSAYDSLNSADPNYRFSVLIKRGIYAADLDAVSVAKPVAWIGEKSRTNNAANLTTAGAVDSTWSAQRARGQEGVILDGTMGQGAGLRFGDETVLEGVIIGNWLSDHPAAQFLFCKRGDQVWGGSVEFMLR